MLEAWRALQEHGDGWYWFAQRLHAGDLYQACSLAAAFRAHHGRKHPLHLVVGEAPHAKIASMFAGEFDKVVVAPGLSNERDDWARLFEATGLHPFGLNTPLLLHPLLNLGVTPRAVLFADDNVTPWMQLYKLILHLPGDAQPSFPTASPHLREEAQRLCRTHCVQPGKSVILFPYAQAHVAHAEEHFAHLAGELRSRGYDVLTSVAPGEAEIPGARPIFIPFPLLPDVAEYAGWVVAVRSGVCDVLSSAHCRKTFVHPDRWLLARWNLRDMDLCRDAIEFPFTSSAGTPQEFAHLVLSEEAAEPPSRANALTTYIGQGSCSVAMEAVSFSDVQGEPDGVARVAERAGAPLAQAPSMLIIHDLPPRTHPRLGDFAERFLAALAAATAPLPVRFYSCRDHGPLNFFEERDASAVVSGRYGAAASWHSVVVVAGASLDELLPPALVARMLPLEAAPVGRRIAFDELEARERRLASATLSRPFGYSGVVLLEGWFQAEPWGAWTNGLHSALSIRLEEPPLSGFSLTLGINGCVSDAFPHLRFTVSVNGVVLADTGASWPDGPWVVNVDVPEALGAERDFLVEFDFAQVSSPRDQGKGGDPRPLGLGLYWIQVNRPASP